MPRVNLRLITGEDLELLLAWAWIPGIWEYMPTSRRGEGLTWESHYNWWYRKANRIDWMILVDDEITGERAVGVVHVILNTDFPEVGLYLGEIPLWGKGIGREALKLVILRLLSHPGLLGHPELLGLDRRILRAVIHPKNGKAIRLFTGLGFKRIGKARKEQDLYELDLSTTNRPEAAVPMYQVGDGFGYQPCPP